MARQKDKGPKPVEIAVAGVLTLLLGLVGGGLFLALQPIKEVREPVSEDEREFGAVYYVRGRSGTQEHQTWQVKKEAVNSAISGEFEVVEQELNLWAANDFRHIEDSGGGFVHIQPSTPSFRIADSELQAALPLEWNIFGLNRKIQSQARGTFERRGGVYTFSPDRVYIGACPVPRVFGLADYFVNKVVAAFEVTPEFRDGWSQIEELSLDGETLRFVIP